MTNFEIARQWLWIALGAVTVIGGLMWLVLRRVQAANVRQRKARRVRRAARFRAWEWLHRAQPKRLRITHRRDEDNE